MGTRERREREKQERRRAILEAARRLFRDKGFAETTMPEIAAAAELAPGTLYLYFPSKPALYVELLIEGYDALLDRLQKAVRAKDAPRGQAEALMDTFLRFARDYPDYFDIIFFVVQAEGRGIHDVTRSKDLEKRLSERELACKRVCADVLLRAPRRGPVAVPDRRVDALWSMLTGVVLHFLRDGDPVFRAVTEDTKRIILRGIFGE